MKAKQLSIILLGLGAAMCAPKEHSRPAADAKEKPMEHARWIEVGAASQRFLIVKIADSRNRPEGAFEGAEAYAGPSAGKHASLALFYILVPAAAAEAEIAHESGGGRLPLPKPRKIHRMPGSALYTHFLADPSRPGSLVIQAGGKPETVDLAARSAALAQLPFFWSGSPPAIAFEEVPGWMEQSGP